MIRIYDVYLSDRCRARFTRLFDAEDYRNALRMRALLAAPDLTGEGLDSVIVIQTRWEPHLSTHPATQRTHECRRHACHRRSSPEAPPGDVGNESTHVRDTGARGGDPDPRSVSVFSHSPGGSIHLDVAGLRGQFSEADRADARGRRPRHGRVCKPE